MVYKDMCFCSNYECEKRKECYRALENHEDVPEDIWISHAHFECGEDPKYNFFVPNRK